MGSRKLADEHPTILYHGVAVGIFDQGYYCGIPVADVAIDADGAPNAYGPAKNKRDKHGCGSDSLTSAGYPTSKDDVIDDDWRNVLVQDLAYPDQPFLKSDGFYISKTSLCNEAATSDALPGKYVDASTVSYLVMPQLWLDRFGIQLGDLCLLWHSRIKTKVVAIVADTCPVDEPLGEMSIAAARALGGKNVSPLDGVEFPRSGAICCVMFLNSRPQLPQAAARAVADVNMAAIRARVKHIVFIIKENRTYDQVLGDLEVGNGDPRLAILGRALSPNHHQLARQFVTLDNFYDSGEHGRSRDFRTSAPASRATSSCVTIRDTVVLTRHDSATTDPAAPVLAEPKRTAPIAVRDVATPSSAELPAHPHSTSPPKSDRSHPSSRSHRPCRPTPAQAQTRNSHKVTA